MGKYMRKPNLTGEMVAVMDVSHSPLGVRTRAKTLALQKLQSSAAPPPSPATEQHRESSYIQLRSRRLEKPPFQQLTCCRRRNPNPRVVNCSGGSRSVGSGSAQIQIEDGGETEEISFGENNLDFGGRERSTRESTPCSSIKDFNVISTPGSSTKSRNLEASNQISNCSVTRSMPLAREIEEFFAVQEEEQQRLFADKYNFDFVNEKPLEGCYEWIKVESI
ncbi:hypothetical protein L1987_03955 [Smallanthus sonchifolius]|uniref:Uncharacterized protein n=1 Tax=Smallanthus sonchifolius TaxID=185202 RepID=A0ACB9KC38_9ASTR|nr:hypothetical protein L1987_03955 [Smallanthus sonchifolius]